MKKRKSARKKSNEEFIKECFEMGLSPQATIDFVIESFKKRVLIHISRTYTKLLAKKLLTTGTPPKEVYSQITWILKVDFGMGMKSAEKKASKLVGWTENPEWWQGGDIVK